MEIYSLLLLIGRQVHVVAVVKALRLQQVFDAVQFVCHAHVIIALIRERKEINLGDLVGHIPAWKPSHRLPLRYDHQELVQHQVNHANYPIVLQMIIANIVTVALHPGVHEAIRPGYDQDFTLQVNRLLTSIIEVQRSAHVYEVIMIFNQNEVWLY